MSWSWEVHSVPSSMYLSVGTQAVKGSPSDEQYDLQNMVEESGSPATGFLYNAQKP